MPIIDIKNGSIQSTNRDAILQDLISQFKSIYGENVYLGVGTEDYNMLSLLADLLSDMGNIAVSVNNCTNLTSAVGTQLDNLASIYYGNANRRQATYSTITVQITGTAGVKIANGQIRDSLGGIWNLPTSVTIGTNGTTIVTATYSQTGAYFIYNTQLNGASAIVTPVAGWSNVSATTNAVAGTNIETDAEYRVKIAQRSRGLGNGTIDALLTGLSGLQGVTEVRIWENDTSSSKDFTDITGKLSAVPAHSIVPVIYGSWANDPSVTVDSTTSTTITNIVVDAQKFLQITWSTGTTLINSGIYTFTREGTMAAGWRLTGNGEDYGKFYDSQGLITYTGTPAVGDTITVTFVAGLTDTQIGQTLYNKKCSGVGTFAVEGDSKATVTIVTPSGQPIQVNYTIAQTQNVQLSVRLKKIDTTASDLTDDAKQAIYNAVITKTYSYRIGDELESNEYFSPIAIALQELGLSTAYIIQAIGFGSSTSPVPGTYALNYDDKAVTQESGITLTIV